MVRNIWIDLENLVLELKNNKNEMEWTKDGVFFPITLKVNEKFYP